jgi:vancomycin resistance protein VanJ
VTSKCRDTIWLHLLVLPALALAGCAARPTRVAADPPFQVPHVGVMTFNLNYGLAGDDATLEAVAQPDADVVCLQETSEAWESLLRARFGATFPHMAFRHELGAGGLGVLSKLPIESVEYLRPGDWFPAARVVLATPIGRLQLLNVHLRPPVSDSGSIVGGYFKTPAIRQREIGHFQSALDSSLPTLVVGDFNESERGGRALRRLRRRGFRSALPEFAPDAHTWSWRTSVYTIRGRYDHLCYDERLEPLRVEVRPAGRSDHLPVVGVFARVGN